MLMEFKKYIFKHIIIIAFIHYFRPFIAYCKIMDNGNSEISFKNNIYNII